MNYSKWQLQEISLAFKKLAHVFNIKDTIGRVGTASWDFTVSVDRLM